MKRNEGKHTDASVAKDNILQHLLKCSRPVLKSNLGYAAFPGYSFKAPQGAALAVAKIARQMEVDGLIRHYHDQYVHGWILTTTGQIAAKLPKSGTENVFL